MSSVRRTLTALTAAVLAVLIGSPPAFAKPAPLIEQEPAPAGGGGGSAGNQFFDGLLPVVLVIAAVLVVAVAGAAVTRIQHSRHLPTAA